LKNQKYKSVNELLAFFFLLKKADSRLNIPVFGLVIHSVCPGGMGFIPDVWSPQLLEPGRWVYWIPVLECGILWGPWHLCLQKPQNDWINPEMRNSDWNKRLDVLHIIISIILFSFSLVLRF